MKFSDDYQRLAIEIKTMKKLKKEASKLQASKGDDFHIPLPIILDYDMIIM
jgi:hypothetical protein